MQVVPYLRWSSDKQGSGSTLPRQVGTIRRYAAERGWPLPPDAEWLRDEGVSGFKGHNLAPAGALGRFTDLVCREGGHGTILVVEQLDRLSRRTASEVLKWFFLVTDAGLTVALADNRMLIDARSMQNQADQLRALLDDADRANSESARKTVLLRQAWASMRDGMDVRADKAGTIIAITKLASVVNPADVGVDITVKTKRGTETYELSTLADGFTPEKNQTLAPDQLLGTVRRKVHVSATCPAWLEISSCRRFFEPIPARVATLTRIFTLYGDGISKTAIARLLNGDATETFRGGAGWRGSSVKALIESRATIGEYQHRSRAQGCTFGDPVPDYFPQVISNELWQAANAPRSGHKREGRGRSIAVRNMFADIARCGSCGSKMYFMRKPRKNGADDAYLQCSNYFMYRHDDTGAMCRDKQMWKYRPILDTLLDHLLNVALDDQHFSNDAEIAALNALIADQRRVIDDLGTQLDNLSRNMAGIVSPRLAAQFTTMEAQEVAAKDALAALEQRMVIARGAVDPAVHVKRVAAIRAEIDHASDEGLRARTIIRDALNGLVETMKFDADFGFVNVVLVASKRYLAIQSDGTLGADFDLQGREPTAAERPFVLAYERRRVAQTASLSSEVSHHPGPRPSAT